MTNHCSARVYTRGGSFSGRPCELTATIERDGKWYCGKHDPTAKQKHREKRHIKWEAQTKVIEAESRYATAVHMLADVAIAFVETECELSRLSDAVHRVRVCQAEIDDARRKLEALK